MAAAGAKPRRPTAARRRPLWIFGLGNFAEMAHHLFGTGSDYEVKGFVVDGAFLDRDSFRGLPAVAWEDFAVRHDPADVSLFVAIGVGRINTLRAARVEQLLAEGWHLAHFVSPTASVCDDLELGPNTMIMDQVNVHPMVRIGHDTIVWSNSRIALKVVIAPHVWITSAVIGESAHIGECSFIGLNATVAPFVRVASHNLIGAAALIAQDTRDHEVYRGPRSRASQVSSLRLRNLQIIR
ncbi:MAG: hypothetical protein ACOVRP_15210 [Gemmatimonas sp.]|jgi:UDP-3-O-[3-hydroxymyristoyl] glucosamine N-acyltransferase